MCFVGKTKAFKTHIKKVNKNKTYMETNKNETQENTLKKTSSNTKKSVTTDNSGFSKNKEKNNIVTKKKFIKAKENEIEQSILYYKVFFAVNSIELKPMEYNILGFLNVFSTLSTPGNKKKFIEYFKSSKHTIESYTSVLYKKGFLEKKDKKTYLKDTLKIDFPVVISVIILEELLMPKLSLSSSNKK